MTPYDDPMGEALWRLVTTIDVLWHTLPPITQILLQPVLDTARPHANYSEAPAQQAPEQKPPNELTTEQMVADMTAKLERADNGDAAAATRTTHASGEEA